MQSIKNINFEVVFFTAYDQYAIKAIKFCALDYLLKPIDIFELIAAIEKVELRIQEKVENHKLKTFMQNIETRHTAKTIALPTIDKVEFVRV